MVHDSMASTLVVAFGARNAYPYMHVVTHNYLVWGSCLCTVGRKQSKWVGFWS